MRVNIPTNILYQNATKNKTEYINFIIRDEHGGSFEFYGDVMCFTLHIV